MRRYLAYDCPKGKRLQSYKVVKNGEKTIIELEFADDTKEISGGSFLQMTIQEGGKFYPAIAILARPYHFGERPKLSAIQIMDGNFDSISYASESPFFMIPDENVLATRLPEPWEEDVFRLNLVEQGLVLNENCLVEPATQEDCKSFWNLADSDCYEEVIAFRKSKGWGGNEPDAPNKPKGYTAPNTRFNVKRSRLESCEPSQTEERPSEEHKADSEVGKPDINDLGLDYKIEGRSLGYIVKLLDGMGVKILSKNPTGIYADYGGTRFKILISEDTLEPYVEFIP